MKISAFFENIAAGALYDGISMEMALLQLKQDGMEQVYISYDTLQKDACSIKKILQELGIGVEGLYGFLPFVKEPENMGYQGIIDMAVKFDAGNVLIVPGFIEANGRKEEACLKKNMWTGLKNAVLYGRKQGIVVSIEDFDGLSAPYCSISGVTEFLKNVAGLQFSFDTGNFVMNHEDELKAFELFQDRICTVHLKDRCQEKDLFNRMLLIAEKQGTEFKKELPVTVCADGERLCTVPVGEGYIQIKEILSRLKRKGYDGGLVVEMYGHPEKNMYDGIRKSVRWIRKNWDMIQ